MEISKPVFAPAATPDQSRKQVQTVSAAFSAQLAAQANRAVSEPRLSGSKGLTEENMAQLLKKYSDKEIISWDERIELFDTMRQLGILDETQYNRAIAICPGMKVASASETTITTGPLLNDSGGNGGLTIRIISPGIPVSSLARIQTPQDLQMWLDALERGETWLSIVKETYYGSYGNSLWSVS